jgi:Tfp pilus assembly protein PilN
MKPGRFLAILLLGGAVVAGGALLMQRQTAALLQTELGLARDEQKEVAKLRAENQRLAAKLPSAESLAAMRADHAAVTRLRTEIETLKQTVHTRERTLGAGPK